MENRRKGVGCGQCYHCKFSSQQIQDLKGSLSYFRFPQDPVRCKLWIEEGNFPELNNIPTTQIHKSYNLCAMHFTRDQFTSDLKTRLLRDAVPSIFDKSAIDMKTHTLLNPEATKMLTTHPEEENVITLLVKDKPVKVQPFTAHGKTFYAVQKPTTTSTNASISDASEMKSENVTQKPVEPTEFVNCPINEVTLDFNVKEEPMDIDPEPDEQQSMVFIVPDVNIKVEEEEVSNNSPPITTESEPVSTGEHIKDYENTCRLCMSSTNTMIDIFETHDNKCAKMILTYLNMKVCRSDGLPEVICQQCLTFLHNIDTFAKSARNIQIKLLRLKQKSYTKNNPLMTLPASSNLIQKLEASIQKCKSNFKINPPYQHTRPKPIRHVNQYTQFSKRPPTLKSNTSNSKYVRNTSLVTPNSSTSLRNTTVRDSRKIDKPSTCTILLPKGKLLTVADGLVIDPNRKKLPFLCEFCNETMTEVQSTKQHYYLTHFKYMCQVCFIHYDTLTLLDAHRTTHNLKCEICDCQVLSDHELINHILNDHKNVEEELKSIQDKEITKMQTLCQQEQEIAIRDLYDKEQQIIADAELARKSKEDFLRKQEEKLKLKKNKKRYYPRMRERHPKMSKPPTKVLNVLDSNLELLSPSTTNKQTLGTQKSNNETSDAQKSNKETDDNNTVTPKVRPPFIKPKKRLFKPLKPLRYTCKLCHLQIQTLTSLKEHYLADHNNSFTCLICFEILESEVELVKHEQLNNHEVVCKICNKRFLTKIELEKHFLENHVHNKDLKDIECTLCEQILSNMTYVGKHYLDVHNKYCCFKCLQIFPTIQDVDDHSLKIHKHKSHWCHKCIFCDKIFPSIKMINFHVFSHHSIPDGDKSVKLCELCGQTFTCIAKLKWHMQGHKVKNKVKKYECSICDLKFFTERRLKCHMYVHNGKKNCVCHICNEAFYSTPGLATHIERVHATGPPKYACEFCDKRYKTRETCSSHKRKHHVFDWQYNCNVCSQQFQSDIEIPLHFQLQHGNTDPIFSITSPHQCSTCNLYFQNRTRLSQHSYEKHHIKLSTGNQRQKRLFYCKYCNKCFKLYANLQKHITNSKNHGDKYNCEHCEQSFDNLTDVKIHLKRKHIL